MYTGGSEVTRDEDSIPGGSQRCQEARSMEINSHQVIQRLPSETLDNVLVILHHVGGDGAVESVGHLHSVVDWVLHEGPGGEGGPGHQNRSMEQTWSIA